MGNNHEPRFLVPALGFFYAATLGAAALGLDQIVLQVDGPWLNVLGAAVLLAAVVTMWQLVRTGWRRHREGLDRRAALWLTSAAATVLLGVVVAYALIQTALFNSIISGADVHLTRPLLESLPRPPGARLIDERPGLASTESITGDFRTNDLAGVIPFYRTTLAKSGWLEDSSSAGTSAVGFFKDLYRVTVIPDKPTGTGDFAVTFDHLNPSLLPSGSVFPSPSP